MSKKTISTHGMEILSEAILFGTRLEHHRHEIYIKEFLEQNMWHGNVYSYLVYDFMEDLGLRKGLAKELMKAFGISELKLYPRPDNMEAVCQIGTMFTLTDVCALMIDLRKLGLDVDPIRLVNVLLKGILDKKYITSNELSILWYKEEKDCSEIEITAPGDMITVSTTLSNEYRVLMVSPDKDFTGEKLDEDKRRVVLKVNGGNFDYDKDYGIHALIGN